MMKQYLAWYKQASSGWPVIILKVEIAVFHKQSVSELEIQAFLKKIYLSMH